MYYITNTLTASRAGLQEVEEIMDVGTRRLLVALLVLVTALPGTGATDPQPQTCAHCGTVLYGLNSLWKFCPACGQALAPAVRTAAALRTLATAVESYAIDRRTFPAAVDLGALATAVEPAYVRVMPRTDGWGRDFLYRTTDARDHVLIASAGPNGTFEQTPEVMLAAAVGGAFGLPAGSDDLVYADGTLVSGGTN